MQRGSFTLDPASCPAGSHGRVRLPTLSPLWCVLLLALVLLAVNPIPYRGGGEDEWQYLNAARCAADHFFCLPADHWGRRLSIVVPAGLSIRFFGESGLALALAPLLYSLGALALFTTIVERQFGRSEALLAGTALVLTPVVTERLIGLNIDLPELFFLLASVACLQSGHRHGRRAAFAAAGILIGLAILCRPTQLALLPVYAAAFILIPAWRRRARAFGSGAAAPLLVEAGAYAARTGDPLYSWRLSLAHTRFPSSEISPSVDLHQSPLFNIAFIDGWKKGMGISVHWTVDAFLNLIVSPAIALTLLAAFALLILDFRWLKSRGPSARLILFLLAAAAIFFGALVFAFAIDPKPRMFLPVLAVACTAFGVLAARRLRAGDTLLVGACLLLLALKGAAAAYDRARIADLAPVAVAWIGAEPEAIAATPNAASLLTLTPAVRRLPIRYDSRPNLLEIDASGCRAAAARFPGWTVEREHPLERAEPAFLDPLRAHGLFLQRKEPIALCLLRRPPA